MIRAVFDASAVISGCGWGAESYYCLVAVARRRARSYATEAIIEQWRETIVELDAEGAKFRRDPRPTLEWLISASHLVVAAPAGKQRSRDPNDDPYLACALAARAEFIITRDGDVLDLGKPFGIQIVTPRVFLNRLHSGYLPSA
jgi:predicted nucleic acid-binding protein